LAMYLRRSKEVRPNQQLVQSYSVRVSVRVRIGVRIWVRARFSIMVMVFVVNIVNRI